MDVMVVQRTWPFICTEDPRQVADGDMEPERRMCPSSELSRTHCPIVGVVSGAPIIGLGLLIILFGGVLLLTGHSPDVTLPPGLLFIGFGAVLTVLGIRR